MVKLQAQYDERVADLTERITDLVNGTRPSGGPERHHGARLKDESGAPIKPLQRTTKQTRRVRQIRQERALLILVKKPA